MSGCIVIKATDDGSHLAFVEWRNHIPLFAPSANLAMVFEHRGMADAIKDKLNKLHGDIGKDWEVFDLDEINTDVRKSRRLLDTILSRNAFVESSEEAREK